MSSWFPNADDPAQGRFVADQVESLAATRNVRPIVVTFEAALLTGGRTARAAQRDAVRAAAATALADVEPLAVRPATAIDPAVPVARLILPVGQTAIGGGAYAAADRSHALAELADRIVGGRQGVVHAHTGYPDGVAAVGLAERLGWPLIVTEHSSFVASILASPARRAAYDEMLEHADRLFAVSEMLAGELREAFPARAARIGVLPNAVPIEQFPAAGREGRSTTELLFVGYRKATKGMEVLLRAMAIARAGRPDLTLRLVGQTKDADEERGWRALAADLGIADAVRFDPPADRAGVAAAMRRAALFVHPSPRETFGVVAAEALSSGLPVVAADSGGVTEILGDKPERLGALVPANDPVALADAIVSTMGRLSSFDAATLRASVEQRFGAPSVAARIVDAYRAAIEESAERFEPAATPLASSGPAAPPEPGTIVIGLDRRRAATRLAVLPDAVRRPLVLVTGSAPAAVRLPNVDRVVEVDVDVLSAATGPAVPSWLPVPLARVARLILDPVGTVRRRTGRDPGGTAGLMPATRALREIATHPVPVIPIDGHDFLAAVPLVDAGLLRVEPGGLGRLADAAAAAASTAADDPGAPSAQPPSSGRTTAR